MIPAVSGLGAWFGYWAAHTIKTVRTERASRRAWNMYRRSR